MPSLPVARGYGDRGRVVDGEGHGSPIDHVEPNANSRGADGGKTVLFDAMEGAGEAIAALDGKHAAPVGKNLERPSARFALLRRQRWRIRPG